MNNKLRLAIPKLIGHLNNKKQYFPNEDAEFYVSGFAKRMNRPRYKDLYQLVRDNYDFYCLFVFLSLDGEQRALKKALKEWHSQLVL